MNNTLTTGSPHFEACESWDRKVLESFQLEALKKQLCVVARGSQYYSRQFERLGFKPEQFNALSALSQLPFTRKSDYAATITPQEPFGHFMCAEQRFVRRMHFSSGTTSTPTPQFWTEADLDRWASLYARNARAQGVEPSDIFQCMFTYTWFVGGLGATAGYQKAGALCIPSGSMDTERQIDTIFRYGSTILCGTPSFILHLAEEMLKRGLNPAATKVRNIMVGGEPGASIRATRERIEKIWAARCYDFYGCLEFQPIAGECSAQDGLHLAEDFAYAEVVHADTGEPVQDGTPGVLVLTHLDKQAGPLVRWWTGDIVVRNRTRCRCGRTHARLMGGVLARADDMLIIRGVNVFPSALEDLVRHTADLTDEYRIILDDSVYDAEGFLKGIRLCVESDANPTAVATQLVQTIRQRLNIHAFIDVVPSGSLERSTHKAKRLIRNRTTHQEKS